VEAAYEKGIYEDHVGKAAKTKPRQIKLGIGQKTPNVAPWRNPDALMTAVREYVILPFLFLVKPRSRDKTISSQSEQLNRAGERYGNSFDNFTSRHRSDPSGK